jgi:glycerol uptake facilitator-like aquaporin
VLKFFKKKKILMFFTKFCKINFKIYCLFEGFAIVALSIAGGPFTDASMNPVRSFGPALWNWNWEHHWIYWVAPMSAGLLASVFYRIIFWRRHPMDGDFSEELPLSRPQKTEL